MADLAEPAGQDVQEEAADEFCGVQGHRLLLIPVSVIPPEEGDLAVLQGQDAVVGDGDAVGIAAQISDDLFRGAEGRLAVDDPLFAAADIHEFLAYVREFLLTMEKR